MSVEFTPEIPGHYKSVCYGVSSDPRDQQPLREPADIRVEIDKNLARFVSCSNLVMLAQRGKESGTCTASFGSAICPHLIPSVLKAAQEKDKNKINTELDNENIPF